jgi:multidrug resistance efflux pump
MQAICVSLVVACAVGQRGVEQPLPTAKEAHMPHCQVSLIDEAMIPAEVAGVLVSLDVRAGEPVRKGQILARVDDEEARVSREAAAAELKAAEEASKNDVEIRYARAAAKVAKAEWDEALAANRLNPNTYSPAEVRRLELNYDKLQLQIEQAQMEQVLKGLTTDVKKAQVNAAELAINKRHIDSPLDGIVVERFKHAGEWVQPGEPILHVVRIDTLRVQGYLEAGRFTPQDVLGKRVKIVVRLPPTLAGPPEGAVLTTTESVISYVSPIVEVSGEFRVWADVKNDRGVIRPGLPAEMTIDVK